MRSFFASALVASLAIMPALAQTFTSCNPLNQTCPDNLALGQYYAMDFTKNDANPTVWNATSTPVKQDSTDGAKFTIKQKGDSPQLATTFHIFFGSISVYMKASPGAGIVSSIVLLSDDLDEIDFEWLGSNTTMVESNYFGKGDTSTYNRAIYHPVTFDPMADFHNYTIEWTKDEINWLVDGQLLRTLTYADSQGAGKFYPQTPCKLYIGSWAGGDPSQPQGVREWAQGTTDYTQGPFTMTVKQVWVHDGQTNASYYHWSDKSGSYQSIKVINGTSPITRELNRVSGPKATWNALPQGARIGIVVGAATGFLALCGLVAFCCIKSTRQGLVASKKADAEWEAQKAEAQMWQQKYNEDRLSTMNSTKSFNFNQPN